MSEIEGECAILGSSVQVATSKRINAEGRFICSECPARLATDPPSPPLTAFVQSAFQAWTIAMCITYRKRIPDLTNLIIISESCADGALRVLARLIGRFIFICSLDLHPYTYLRDLIGSPLTAP